MDDNAIKWVCRIWRACNDRKSWEKISDQLQGAGMAIFAVDSQAGMDYWTLSDLAQQHYLETWNDD